MPVRSRRPVPPSPPGRFHYEPPAEAPPREVEDHWVVRDLPGGERLGEVALRPDGSGHWLARGPRGGAAKGEFPSRRDAALFLWSKHSRVDKLGHDAAVLRPSEAGRNAEPPGGKSLFRELAESIGFTISMATRVAGVNTRTGRRWAQGLDHNGKSANPPPATLQLLRELAEENERALALEARGLPGPRPLRDRAVKEAAEREAARRRERLAEGKRAKDSGGSGERRMLKENERALRRVKRAAAAAAMTGDTEKLRRRVALEVARMAGKGAARKPPAPRRG